MPGPFSPQVDDRLEEFTDFGSNPGDLIARSYVPRQLSPGAPLVVVLHGCTQSAGSYNHGAGWTSAADEHGFALLFPEQQRSNNPNLCFNWFSPADATRGKGEASSIAQMVEGLCSSHALDRRRVFITGLSAGGAMAAAMLATYPDLFAGGAVIAGLPFGTAATVPEAFERMRGQDAPEPGQLARLVRAASKHTGKWPVLSVWHGSSDATVDASNAASLVAQWRGLHGLPESPSTTQTVAGYRRRVWCDHEGTEVLEEYMIRDMGHGTPIDPKPAKWGEAAGPYMLDVGLSSTRRIVSFWGVAGRGEMSGKAERIHVSELPSPAVPGLPSPHRKPAGLHAASGKRSVQAVIETALRSAGLMR